MLDPNPAVTAALPLNGAQEESDEGLMQRYGAGDAGAFETLYRRHRSRLFRFLVNQTGSRVHAEELHQDIWMNLIRWREAYVPSARFSTYLLTLAHHRVVDHYRQKTPNADYFADVQIDHAPEAQRSEPIDPAYQAELNQEVGRIDAALLQLSPEQREIFLLHQQTDADLTELAELTGVSRETAKSRLRYALKHLRRLLGAPK